MTELTPEAKALLDALVAYREQPADEEPFDVELDAYIASLKPQERYGTCADSDTLLASVWDNGSPLAGLPRRLLTSEILAIMNRADRYEKALCEIAREAKGKDFDDEG